MEKKYLIEFIHADGTVEEVELVTDRLKWSIDQWSRNRAIVSHKIILESELDGNEKRMLFD